jgi:hypothetical protein
METSLRNARAAGMWPEPVVISSGSAACDLDPARPWLGDMEPLGLQMVAEAIERFDQALFVASAGNRSTFRRYHPAAFDEESVVAVGALDVGTRGHHVDLAVPVRAASLVLQLRHLGGRRLHRWRRVGHPARQGRQLLSARACPQWSLTGVPEKC